MIKTYLFNHIKYIRFLRGFFPFYTKKSLIDLTSAAKTKRFVWRTSYSSTIKITESYADKPAELANFLFLRTRESNMLRARSNKGTDAVKYRNYYTTGSDSKMLKIIGEDLCKGFGQLNEITSILKPSDIDNLPVSFASNVLYVSEKNGMRKLDLYKNVIFPLLKKKAKYLHAEGLASSIWALGQLEHQDSDLILKLLEIYKDKTFGTDLTYVSNVHMSTDSFVSGEKQHGFEYDSTAGFRDLYFKDYIVCLELFDGLKSLSTKKLSSEASAKVNEILKDVEAKHRITSDYYLLYKQIIEATPSRSIE